MPLYEYVCEKCETKFEALIAVQGQCLEAVQQFRNGRRAGQD